MDYRLFTSVIKIFFNKKVDQTHTHTYTHTHTQTHTHIYTHRHTHIHTHTHTHTQKIILAARSVEKYDRHRKRMST